MEVSAALSPCRELVLWQPPVDLRPRTGLVVVPHPLTLSGRRHARAVPLLPGETLASVLARHQVDTDEPGWEVSIDGARVPRELWARVRPRGGHLIQAHRVAGRSTLRIVALIAVIVYAPQLAAAMLPAGASAFAVTAATVAIQMVGSAIVNRVLGPKTPRISNYDQQTASTYSLSGGRNRARHYEPLGLVLGSVKVVPDYAAQPYSWFDSDDQYLYCRFHAGINCGSVASIKIGDTAIETYADVLVSQAGFPGVAGNMQDWSSVDTVAGATVDAVTAPGAYVVRTSSSGTARLAIDIGAQLYDMTDQGTFNTASLSFEAERRLLPSGAWQPFVGSSATITLTSQSTKPLRRTIDSGTVVVGQWEVRLRKTTANVSDARRANVLEWATLKSVQLDYTNYTSHPQVGVRIRATGQLNGSLDEVNWVATGAATPVWNGSGWATTATSNPGALILQLARGIYDSEGRLMAGLGWADSQIDIAGLQDFMVHCASQGYRFDLWLDQPMSCMELLDAIAAAGLGSIDFHSGKLTVVYLSNTRPIEAVVSMANIKQGSFRVDYTTRELAQEIESAWRDRDDNWLNKSLRVLAPGVSVPRDTARIQPIGATTTPAVVRATRLAMAQNIYQRKAVSWEMDLEHVTFRRYMLLSLSHDMTQWGYGGQLRSAVVISGSQVQLTLDEPVPFNSGAGYRAIGLRLPGESQFRIFNVAAFSGESRVLTLTTAWPGGVPVPGSSADNPAHDTLWIYDFKGVPGQRLCVVGIEPTSDLSGARITAVPEPDEFWTFMNTGAYTVPAIGSSLALVASNIVVTQDRANLTFDGSTNLAVTFDVIGIYDRAELWMGLTGTALQRVGDTRTRRFDDVQVVVSGTYNIEVRPFDGLGRRGTVAARTYTVAVVRVAEQGFGQNQLAESDQMVLPRFYVAYNPNGAVFDGGDVRYPESFGFNQTNFQLVGNRSKLVVVRQIGRHTGTTDTSNTDGFGNHVACFAAWNTPGSPVRPLERMALSLYGNSHNSRWCVLARFYTAAGTLTSAADDKYGNLVDNITNGTANSQCNTLDKLKRSTVVFEVPASAAIMQLFAVKYNTFSGQSESYLFFGLPQLEVIAANAAGASPYSSGSVGAIGTEQLLDGAAQNVVDFFDAAGAVYLNPAFV